MKKEVYYPDYLKLDDILSAQAPLSRINQEPAHDEMLFIITHQTLELWMKQIHHELDSIISMFSKVSLEHSDLARVLHQLERVIKVQDLMRAHFNVLETMTPLDFLDFRDALIPASGFQSVQFKQLEKKLGIQGHQSNDIKRHAKEVLSDKDQKKLDVLATSLFECIEGWLERNPFIKMKDYDFETEFVGMVKHIFQDEISKVKQHPFKRKEDQEDEEKNIENLKKQFDKDLNEEQQGLNKKAFLSALFIHLYRDHALLHLPYQILRTLVALDQKHTRWKQRHLGLVRMMIGLKTGTGGTSGQGYLSRSIGQSSIFPKLVSAPSYMTSRQDLKPLPDFLAKQLSFKWV